MNRKTLTGTLDESSVCIDIVEGYDYVSVNVTSRCDLASILLSGLHEFLQLPQATKVWHNNVSNELCEKGFEITTQVKEIK